MTYHRVCSTNITFGTTSGTGTGYPSEAPEFIPRFKRDSCCSIIIFLWSVLGIIICPFVLFRLAILVTPFVIFKLFFSVHRPIPVTHFHIQNQYYNLTRGRRSHDRMIDGFTTTYAISVYHH